MLRTAALLLGALCALACPASATTIGFQFDSTLQTGALAGTQFTGTASYNNAGSTGVGTEYFFLTSLNFTLLGDAFTLADLSEGGDAVLVNGTLSYFTAAFFPTPQGSAPVDDIAFGFGGPGTIGYTTPPGFSNFGSGVYVIESPVPEPSTLSLCCMALLACLFASAGARMRGAFAER
jgi:hypothetical protein